MKASLFNSVHVVYNIIISDVRDDIIKWFIKTQLADYDMLFHESLETAWLDKVSYNNDFNYDVIL